MKTDAKFSDCRKYRYALWRTWDESKPCVMFIGLNPSTANEVDNDSTINRCIDYAKSWGYGSLCMANLFAFKATKPTEMFAATEPIGVENDAWLKSLASQSALVVAAWGNDGSHQDRSTNVKKMLGNLYCLKINATGEPAHPLYQPANAKPIPLPI